MTKEEATFLLKQVNEILIHSNSWLENTHKPLNQAFEMAIKALEQQKPIEKFESAKDHIFKLAGDYKCWDNRLTFEEAIELCHILEQQPSEDKVSVEVYKQVMSERDIAIEQLRELGYSFGEKIRTSDDCVSREKVWYMITGGKYANEDYEQFIDRLVKELENMPPVTPFPKGATNGDMIKTMFPNIKIHKHEKTDICDAYIQIDIWDFAICVSKDWWDEPYKRGSENGSN